MFPVEHCRGRCYEPYDPLVLGCRCDADCTAGNNCCYDYHDVCLLPGETPYTRPSVCPSG